MKPYKEGQIVKFHTPYPDENPKQLYLLKEVFDYGDGRAAQALIQALNTDLGFAPINSVFLNDLEPAEVDTTDLIGYCGSIISETGNEIQGRIIQLDQKKLFVELTKEKTRIDTNLKVTIKDKKGELHHGRLVVLF